MYEGDLTKAFAILTFFFRFVSENPEPVRGQRAHRGPAEVPRAGHELFHRLPVNDKEDRRCPFLHTHGPTCR